MRQSGKQQHGRTRLAHRNSMTGECSTARGGSGTVIRHYFPARTFPAPAPVAPLTLGMTVPAASRVLIPTSRRAQRFASGEAAATCSAVLLAPITARADEHLALTPRTQKQSDIVHRSPRRGGLDDPRSPGNTALGAVRKCGSGRSLGRDRQVNSVRGCVGLLAESDLTPTPERRHRGNAPRRRALLGHIGSGRIQRQLSGGDAGTTQSMFTPPFGRSCPGGLFTIYPRFHAAINTWIHKVQEITLLPTQHPDRSWQSVSILPVHRRDQRHSQELRLEMRNR